MAEVELDYLAEVAGQGFENMSNDEVAVPRLLIAQALSDVVQNDSVKVGHFYNSITGKDYGEAVDLIVCHFQNFFLRYYLYSLMLVNLCHLYLYLHLES